MDPGAYPPWRDALANGARAAFVAAICYATASRLAFVRDIYWAPIAAVVVLYPDRDSTQKAGIDRFLGTAIGSIVGWGSAAWWHERVAVYAVAVFVAVGICHLASRPAAARLCAVTVSVITLVPRDGAPGIVAFHRFMEVSYGVLCALAYALVEDRVRRWTRGGPPA